MNIFVFILGYFMISFLAGTISVKFGTDDPQENFWVGFCFWPIILPIVILAAPVFLINKYVDLISK